ncbi:MAG: hypothetical protein RIG84_18805 [Roseovarius sp.]
MSGIYVPTTSLEDWQALLADPVKHWRAGFSAMATARAWEAAKGLPPEVAEILGPGAELLLAIPEHKVPLPGGERPSQCDVFALARQGGAVVAVAVEAKVDEPFDRTLGGWMGAGSPGKRARLAAICEILGCGTPPDDLRYQLFHRTAAAVIEARRFGAGRAAMVVHSFSPGHRWFEDFAAFCAFLGLGAPERGRGYVLPLPEGRTLTLGWATGAPGFLEPAPLRQLPTA